MRRAASVASDMGVVDQAMRARRDVVPLVSSFRWGNITIQDAARHHSL